MDGRPCRHSHCDDVSGLLSAAVSNTYGVGSTHLTVQQAVYFNDAGRKNIVQFVATFTNHGSAAISLQYGRAVDPNQGVAPPGNSDDVETSQWFGTPVDPTQFAILSMDQMGLRRDLALGVRATDPNAPGSTIFACSAGQTETALLGSISLTRQGNPNHVVLEGKLTIKLTPEMMTALETAAVSTLTAAL